MESKRIMANGPAEEASNSFSALLDSDLKKQLSSVGPRVRRQISEGHSTKGTSLPSFQGLTVGTLDQEQLRRQFLAEAAARPFHSTSELDLKRNRDDDMEDEYGDTEDDEAIQPSVDVDRKVFYRPLGHRSRSGQNDDFEDAAFLK